MFFDIKITVAYVYILFVQTPFIYLMHIHLSSNSTMAEWNVCYKIDAKQMERTLYLAM